MRVLKYLILTGQIGIIFTGATRYLYQRANSLGSWLKPFGHASFWKRHHYKEGYIWRDNQMRNQSVGLRDYRKSKKNTQHDGTKVIAHLKTLSESGASDNNQSQ